MEKKNSSSSRSQNAKNEMRDSQGRFESSDKKNSKTTASGKSSSNMRGENAKDEKRDSHGRFESDSKSKK